MVNTSTHTGQSDRVRVQICPYGGDKPLIYISCNGTTFCMQGGPCRKRPFSLQRNFVLDQTPEELADVGRLNQPDYAFSIDNGHEMIHCTLNAGTMHVNFIAPCSDTKIWTEISPEGAQQLYFMLMEKLDGALFETEGSVPLQIFDQWVSYETTRSTVSWDFDAHSPAESSESEESEGSEESDGRWDEEAVTAR